MWHDPDPHQVDSRIGYENIVSELLVVLDMPS